MAILAAKCPCCGRDIGIEENTEEYTCVFCGTKLKVSALKTELLDAPSQEDDPSSDSRRGSRHGSHRSSHRSSHHSSHHSSGDGSHHSHHHSEETRELTEEEKEEQLKLKAEYKEELKESMHQLNELRAKRPPLEKKQKMARAFLWAGAGFASLALAAAGWFVYRRMIGIPLYAAAGAAAIGLAVLITAYVKLRGVKKEKSALDQDILEKKQKRDILVGRLNKINRLLHIHSEE